MTWIDSVMAKAETFYTKMSKYKVTNTAAVCYDKENIGHEKEKAPTLIIEHDIRSQNSHYITTSLWGSMIVADRWNGKESFQALRRFLLLFLAESGFILGQDRPFFLHLHSLIIS